MRILVIGCTGMLGSSIMFYQSSHELWGTYLGKKPLSKKTIELDITNYEWVKRILYEVKPDVMIHTAAITDVDLCEEQPNLAKNIHIKGTENLMNVCDELGIYFIYISTDSVFDGYKGNYKEIDQVNPLNMYAKTKYQGELISLKYRNSCVVRTNIYGFNWLPKKSIAEWILDSLRNNHELTLFKDVFFTPILTNIFAEILFEIIENRCRGVFHVSGSESISKLNFGIKIAETYGLKKNKIIPISYFDLNLKAPRPLNPSLNCSKIQKIINKILPNVQEGILEFKNLESSDYIKKLKNF